MIEKKIIRSVRQRLRDGKPIHQSLPGGGTLNLDKLLPYLCIYRFSENDLYFSRLLRTQAAYLIAPRETDLSELITTIAATVSEKLNAFLIIEMWPVRREHRATFEILGPKEKAPATVRALEKGFEELHEIYPEVAVQVRDTNVRHPEALEPLMEIEESKRVGTLLIGLAVPTIYEREEEETIYSLFYRKFHSAFSQIIKRAAFEFIRVQTANPFNHYLMLGKTELDDITRKADRELARISEGMSFLLRTTPVNSTSEWKKFQKGDFRRPPAFHYRLITIDPEKKKRKLYDIPLDRVEDPTLAFIFRDKRLEIEKQLTMLEERGTDSFRYIGESLYGKIGENVLEGARTLLQQHPRDVVQGDGRRLDCHEFAEFAQEEIDYYQARFPDLKLSLEIRSDIAGIMVSKSKLLIGDQMTVADERRDALIQHEVGTHILTYCNGRIQPLRQMYAGFAGYDQLQEGLAVISEYLVGGLTVNRMRILAGRVLAAESMVKGADFVQTFDLLRKGHNFDEQKAYYITMRIYRGGGLTKDSVYLSGLIHVLDYLANGGKLDLLYTGKFDIGHVAMVEELLHRNVLNKPVLPRFLNRPEVQRRIGILHRGLQVTELLSPQVP